MQLAGDRFAAAAIVAGNDIATFSDFPAEIRAPEGTLPGVSSFQIQFADHPIFTAGDAADVLVAMNPAALAVNLKNVKPGGVILVNADVFVPENLKKANWKTDPLSGETLAGYRVLKVGISSLTYRALEGRDLKNIDKERCKNLCALGLLFGIFERDPEPTRAWIEKRFTARPEIAGANTLAFMAGVEEAASQELAAPHFRVSPARIAAGTYRKVTGNEAAALGLVAAAEIAKKTLMYGSYPITPASDILHELARRKNFAVKTFQAEDEIAAIGFAIGAAFAGAIGVTGTSGPGLALMTEMLGLAVMAELPTVVWDVQRAGPSTGMPTKTSQGDLLMSLFGRPSPAPMAVFAPRTGADCFDKAILAVKIALEFVTPVMVLSDAGLANASQPWRLPDPDRLPSIRIKHPVGIEHSRAAFHPYHRDPSTLARLWALPGTPGLEHRIGGMGKSDETGNVRFDPAGVETMTRLREKKINRIARVLPDLVVRGPKIGKLLVMGWGGTFGVIHEAVSRLTAEGVTVSHTHLDYLNPFPSNLEAIVGHFEKVLIPELNDGQLATVLRGRFPSARFESLQKLQGQPFRVEEITAKIRELLAAA
ncbi:MAG: 2-oxoacid:acceptor oxidoreductase subunit alpha [Candidatus Omnitrophica bacterium]|nr:2-oxoacid:acceptor oxidoreductase subunit alpha [Candidatus Omnitrophota bacterium]